MYVATTTADFNKYADTHEEKIELLHKCGFKHIDFSFYGKNDNLPFLKENWVDYTKSLKEFAKDTRAFKPLLELKMQTEKLMYNIGVEILEKYNIKAE